MLVTEWEIDLELKKLKYSAKSKEGEHFAGSKIGAETPLPLFYSTFFVYVNSEKSFGE